MSTDKTKKHDLKKKRKIQQINLEESLKSKLIFQTYNPLNPRLGVN